MADQVFVPDIIEMIPDELWMQILQKPMRATGGYSEPDKLSRAAGTSRHMRRIVQEVRKNDAPQLKGFQTRKGKIETGKQAVDYLIDNPTIRYAYLDDFKELTDADLNKLIAHRKDLQGLRIHSDKLTDLSLCLPGTLTELEEFKCEGCQAKQIDLRNCIKLRTVDIIGFAPNLKNIILPEEGKKLDYVFLIEPF